MLISLICEYVKSQASSKWLFAAVYYGGLAFCCYFTYLHIMELREYSSNLMFNAAPNFLAVPITFAFAFPVANDNRKVTALFCALGVVGYEFMQLGMDERTFDSLDVLFSVIGYGFMLLAIKVEKKIASRF
ncbi:hypothetical protein [Alteromonas sp. KUL106]|uniref:hypothetical protein n=1 Tax=Alteromonas sp. KUL106 TaxID=2480799 RepID=UPI0012E44215|nr:hypothetical protein [Alteromonas sp. KUL106]GFD69606.1 hypothetical protein KUL106_28690 [Alteromonas sp. KUL106]